MKKFYSIFKCTYEYIFFQFSRMAKKTDKNENPNLDDKTRKIHSLFFFYFTVIKFDSLITIPGFFFIQTE